MNSNKFKMTVNQQTLAGGRSTVVTVANGTKRTTIMIERDGQAPVFVSLYEAEAESLAYALEIGASNTASGLPSINPLARKYPSV